MYHDGLSLQLSVGGKIMEVIQDLDFSPFFSLQLLSLL